MRYRPFFQRAHSPELTAGDRTQCVISVSTEFREGEKKKKRVCPRAKDVWSLHVEGRPGQEVRDVRTQSSEKCGQSLLTSPFFSVQPHFSQLCWGWWLWVVLSASSPRHEGPLPDSSVTHTWSAQAHPGDTQEEHSPSSLLVSCSGDWKRLHELYSQWKLSPASQFRPTCLCFEVWLLPFTILFLKCIKDV